MAEPYVQPQAYDESGQPVALTPEALASGKAGFAKGARVYAKDPYGQLVTIDAGSSTPGYTILSPDQLEKAYNEKEYGTGVGNMALAGGAGLARGASLGLSDPAIAAVGGPGARRALKGLQQANPNLSIGSELVGAVGAAIAAEALSGGAATPGLAGLAARGALTPMRAATALGKLAEAAAPAGEGLLAAGARMGARGAVEGALYGAGSEVSRATLDDVPLTAERLLAGAWDGARMGGAFGAGAGVVTKGIGKLGRRLLGKLEEEGAVTPAAAAEAAPLRGSWLEGNATPPAVEGVPRPQGYAPKGLPFEAAAARAEDIASDVGAKPELQTFLNETRRAVSEGERAGVDGATSREVTSFLHKAQDAGAFYEGLVYRGTNEAELAKIAQTGRANHTLSVSQDPDGARAFAKKGGVLLEIKDHPVPVDGIEGSNTFSEALIPKDSRARIVGERYENGQRVVSLEMGEQPPRPVSEPLGVDLGPAEPFGPPAAPPPAPPAAPAAKEPFFTPDNTRELGSNLLMGILTGHPLAGVAAGAGIKLARKLIQERGADAMATLADRLSSVQARIELAGKVAAMVEPLKSLATPTAYNTAKLFKHYSGVLQQAKEDPGSFVQRMADVTEGVALEHPDVAQQIQSTMVADQAYLDNLHPQPASRLASTLTPQVITQEYYAYDQQRAFVEAATALDNPLGVFDSIARGELPLVAIEALKIRRPALYGDMRQAFIKHTLTRKTQLPFKRRILGGVAFDFAADWSMLHIAPIQASLASDVQKPDQQQLQPPSIHPGDQMAPGKF